jgi:hypothetical protein
MNRGSVSDKETSWRVWSGFSRGSTRLTLENGRGRSYFNIGKGEQMNEGSDNDHENTSDFTVTKEALITEIEHLQKRLGIALKELNHSREEIKILLFHASWQYFQYDVVLVINPFKIV